MKNKKLILIGMLLICLITSQAQEIILTSGANLSSSEGSINYSIGQIFYNTNVGTTGTVFEGIQLPYEISVISEVESNVIIDLSMSVYPNPTTDYLILKVENQSNNIYYQLYDAIGKLLINSKIETTETSINMVCYKNALYILKVFDNNKVLKTFKIIKN